MLACRLWENPTESLWFCFTNSLRQLPSLPKASVLHVTRHFSKLLEVLETLLLGRKMKATRPEMPALCRGDWKSLVPALTSSTCCKRWADFPRTLYRLRANTLTWQEECIEMSSHLSCFPAIYSPASSVNHLHKSSLVLKTCYWIVPSVMIWIQMLCVTQPCGHHIVFVVLIGKTLLIALRRCKQISLQSPGVLFSCFLVRYPALIWGEHSFCIYSTYPE